MQGFFKTDFRTTSAPLTPNDGLQGKKYIVRWHPFQLNPSASQEGIEKLDFYNTKFGKERTQQMVPFMRVGSGTFSKSTRAFW